jgi:predicted flap endonuclease-1-like 5' DNA nuclease
MRSDIALYVVAAFFFVLTIISAFVIVEEEKSLWVISTAVLGVLSVGLGYYQRPRAVTPIQKIKTVTATQPAEPIQQTAQIEASAPTEQAPVSEANIVIEKTAETEKPKQQSTVEQPPAATETTTLTGVTEPKPAQTPTEAPVTTAQTEPVPAEQPTENSLTKVRGIGEKRAAQLNVLGIHTVEELAQASVEEVAKNLKVSPKIVAKWVENAKQQ